MDAAEKVIVACFLIDQGVDGEAISTFVDVLEHGCDLGETDALSTRQAFRERVLYDVPDGHLGGIIRLMQAKMELDVIYHDHQTKVAAVRDIERIVANVPQNEFAARLMVRKVQDVILRL